MSASVFCLVPAFNAGKTLGGVVRDVRVAVPQAVIIAVDDGSSDNTRDVAGVTCDATLSFEENRGKGAALRAGLSAALARGAGMIVTIDADGQHDASRIPDLLAALEGADVAVGVRRRTGGRMPLRRRLANSISSTAIQYVAGVPIPDSQSGFRAMRRAVPEKITGGGDRYEYETEFLIRTARAGFRIVSVPIPTIYGSESHFRAIADSMRVIRSIWHHRKREET